VNSRLIASHALGPPTIQIYAADAVGASHFRGRQLSLPTPPADGDEMDAQVGGDLLRGQYLIHWATLLAQERASLTV
jgi:hypothetical protein